MLQVPMCLFKTCMHESVCTFYHCNTSCYKAKNCSNSYVRATETIVRLPPKLHQQVRMVTKGQGKGKWFDTCKRHVPHLRGYILEYACEDVFERHRPFFRVLPRCILSPFPPAQNQCRTQFTNDSKQNQEQEFLPQMRHGVDTRFSYHLLPLPHRHSTFTCDWMSKWASVQPANILLVAAYFLWICQQPHISLQQLLGSVLLCARIQFLHKYIGSTRQDVPPHKFHQMMFSVKVTNHHVTISRHDEHTIL